MEIAIAAVIATALWAVCSYLATSTDQLATGPHTGRIRRVANRWLQQILRLLLVVNHNVLELLSFWSGAVDGGGPAFSIS